MLYLNTKCKYMLNKKLLHLALNNKLPSNKKKMRYTVYIYMTHSTTKYFLLQSFTNYKLITPISTRSIYITPNINFQLSFDIVDYVF